MSDREGEGGGKEGGGGDRIGKGEALLRRQPIQVQSMDTLDALSSFLPRLAGRLPSQDNFSTNANHPHRSAMTLRKPGSGQHTQLLHVCSGKHA